MRLTKLTLLSAIVLMLSGCATTQDTQTVAEQVTAPQTADNAENEKKETRRVCQETTQVGSRLNNRSC